VNTILFAIAEPAPFIDPAYSKLFEPLAVLRSALLFRATVGEFISSSKGEQ
jgi:hypothetical protein